MSSLDNRENAFENKYAQDQETLFRIESRASKLLGLWAAQEMGLAGEAAESYAASVIVSNLKEVGVNDVIAKVGADMAAKGKPTELVAAMMHRFMREVDAEMHKPA